MREFNVLFGFKSQKIEDAIMKELQAMGFRVNATMRFSKQMISDYVNSHPELDAIVLKEYLDGGEKYSSKELAELVDNVFVNVVIVLEQKHRGRDTVKELYSAGILNAFFADGRLGVNPDKLAEACVHSRTRAQAREYYRIKETVVTYDKLVYEEFLDCYRYLLNKEYGVSIMDRFVTITRWLSPMQMASFILTIPESVTEILKGYDEYYDVCWKLYRLRCLDTKIKKTKQTKKGLTPEIFHEEMKGAKNKTRHQEVQLKSVSTSRIETAESAPKYEIEGDIMEMDPRPVNDKSGAPDIYSYAEGLGGNDKPEKKLSRREMKALEKARKKEAKLQKREERTGILPEVSDADVNFAAPVSGNPVLSSPPVTEEDMLFEDSLYNNAMAPQNNKYAVPQGGYSYSQNNAQNVPPVRADEAPPYEAPVTEPVVEQPPQNAGMGQQAAKEPDLSMMSVEELINMYGK